MSRLRMWAWRLAALFDGRRSDRELAEEMATNLDLHAADAERAGLSPEAARRRARLALGGVDATMERYRDQRGIPLIETTVQDVRLAARGFRKNPGFAAAALVVLALGIGANAAIFTVVDAVLLKPLPYREAGRLVMVWHVPPPASFPGMKRFPVSAANYLDWERQQHVFESMSVQHHRIHTLTGGGQSERVIAVAVSAGSFDVFGARPLLGRTFLREEDEPGRSQVAVLSHRLWQSRFGGDRTIVGRPIMLDGKPYTVVGVMDASFRFPDRAQLWTPLAWTVKEREVRGEHSLIVVARLAPGVDIARAQADMTTISHRLELQYPEDDKGWGAVVRPLREDMVGDLRPSLFVLLGAVAFVLLIACANVANLVLARTLARRREMALRLALGAGAGRIVRQVLTETTLLALAGGALGLTVAHGGVALIVAFFGERLPQAVPVRADVRVIAFTGLVSLVTGLAAGLVPALRLAKASVAEGVRQGGARTEADQAGGRVRSALVVVEVALSLMLLVGAGLMIRTLWQIGDVNPGFDQRDLLTAEVLLPETRYPQAEQQVRFFQAMLDRVRTVPNVEAAAVVTNLPLVGGNNWPVAVAGRPPLPMSEQAQVQGNVITPGYLTAMRIPLVRGRDITEVDRADAPAVALVSEAMARWLWPNEDPIGQRLTTAFYPDAVREVVGIVKDVKERGLTERGTASMYLPHAQLATPWGTVVVRTRTSPPSAAGPALVTAVHELDSDLAVVEVKSMDTVVSESMSDRRFTMLLLVAFAALALLLAAVGIYSVLAYAVRRRVREIGIRMALGAGRPGVVRMVVADALRPTVLGLAIGLVGAVAIRSVMASLLFGVGAGDPLTFTGVCTLFVAVALASSALPAYWATQVDPIVTLREE